MFNPKELSKEQLESCVEEYLGIHPRYLLYTGNKISLNVTKLHEDGTDLPPYEIFAFKPAKEKEGQ